MSLCEVDTQRQLFPEQTALDSETMRNYCNTSFVKRILRCFNRTVPWVQMALGMGRGHGPLRFIVLLLIEGAKGECGRGNNYNKWKFLFFILKTKIHSWIPQSCQKCCNKSIQTRGNVFQVFWPNFLFFFPVTKIKINTHGAPFAEIQIQAVVEPNESQRTLGKYILVSDYV